MLSYILILLCILVYYYTLREIVKNNLLDKRNSVLNTFDVFYISFAFFVYVIGILIIYFGEGILDKLIIKIMLMSIISCLLFHKIVAFGEFTK
jgi:hypothetical protein